ncbi:hypothetical protein MASR2M69_19380 [Bacteroidota bacterium]
MNSSGLDNILFIAPIPPPITGQSLASFVLFENLKDNYKLQCVNLSKNSLVNGVSSIQRIFHIIEILFEIFRQKKQSDIIYLTISESISGNIKDLLVYLICFNKLSKCLIHLHGGSLKKDVFDRNTIIYYINIFFLKRVGGIIILGNTHKIIFDNIIQKNKIHIVSNFSQDYLFIDDKSFNIKFMNSKLNITFLSNLIIGKGFDILLDSLKFMDNEDLEKINIFFAGQFDSSISKNQFINKIKQYRNVKYLGIVDSIEKRNLLFNSQIFCLPTSLNEGQPISILEAYASGCVVLTSLNGGIPDIFCDNENGYAINPLNSYTLYKIIIKSLNSMEHLKEIAKFNRSIASRKYNTNNYISSIKNIIDSIK